VTHQPRILAHRGASGYSLENSLEAFRDAIRRGADGVELDVHATRDGHLVVHHDPVILGLGAIAAVAAAELRRALLSDGNPAPTLLEALEAIGDAETWIEVKALPEQLDRTLLRAIDESPAPGRCAVHSFDHRIVARLGALRPGLRRGVLSSSYPRAPGPLMLAAGATALWQDWRLIDSELVETVHRRGGEVIAWTVNDSNAARRLAALGVDALCGNYPERLRLG
jgi:glycerophosphoryl diester phosphodiesterase